MWMIYGATGYTGKLIAEECARRGLKPILAGRSAEIRALALRLGLEARVFPLSDARAGIAGMKAVLHCAGPFSATARPMLDACLANGAHYLDITGEIDVFEMVQARGAEISKAGVAAIPGVGFDVVPSDCLAAMLKAKLPGANRLAMSFKSSEKKPSHGTARTMVEGLAGGSRVRRAGKIISIPAGSLTRMIELTPGKPRNTIAIPWGDVSTAFHSTGIPDIEVYIPTSRAQILGMKLLSRIARFDAVRAVLDFAVDRTVKGPSADDRERGRSLLWGEVRDGEGRTETLRLEIPEGYRFTVDAAIACTERVLKGVPAGALTPSRAFGAEFVLSLPGCKLV